MATSTLLLLSLIPACGLFDFDARTNHSEESSNSDSAETGSTAVERVELGMAGDFAILAKSGISTVLTSEISDDLGLSPAAATFITGFSSTAHCVGIILAKTSITLRTGASVDGRLLAQTAVNLEGSTVTDPAE